MSGIKTLLDNESTGFNDDDMGEAFGRYAMGQELLRSEEHTSELQSQD